MNSPDNFCNDISYYPTCINTKYQFTKGVKVLVIKKKRKTLKVIQNPFQGSKSFDMKNFGYEYKFFKIIKHKTPTYVLKRFCAF